MLIAAAPVTMSLVVGGLIFALLIAIPVGLLSALRPRTLLDRFSTVFVLIGISAHPVWLGLLLSYFLGYRLELMPTGGYCEIFTPTTFCGGPVQWAYHLILPWIAFGFMFAALYMRMTRASVLESLHEEYVRTARAKGAPEWLVVRSHVLRNALLPIVTMVGMDLGIALGGTIFVESIFGLPGLRRARGHLAPDTRSARPARDRHLHDGGDRVAQPRDRPALRRGSTRAPASTRPTSRARSRPSRARRRWRR